MVDTLNEKLTSLMTLGREEKRGPTPKDLGGDCLFVCHERSQGSSPTPPLLTYRQQLFGEEQLRIRLRAIRSMVVLVVLVLIHCN